MPGFDAKRAAANPFHPRFVKLLEGFGVLRFMGWMEANTDAVPRTWAERAKPTDRYRRRRVRGMSFTPADFHARDSERERGAR